MFEPKGLERAFLFSFAFHLVWMALFTVVLLPGRFRMEEFPEISFLGPILTEISFPGAETQKLSFVPLPGRISRRFIQQEVSLEVPSVEFLVPERKSSLEKPVFFLRSRKPRFLPAALAAESEKVTSADGTLKENREAAGLKRKPVYQPPLPDYRHWLEEESGSFEVGLRFLISPEGTVKVVEVFRTCGYPEIDLLARRYLKSWIFLPLAPGDERSDEWETTILTFRPR